MKRIPFGEVDNIPRANGTIVGLLASAVRRMRKLVTARRVVDHHFRSTLGQATYSVGRYLVSPQRATTAITNACRFQGPGGTQGVPTGLCFRSRGWAAQLTYPGATTQQNFYSNGVAFQETGGTCTMHATCQARKSPTVADSRYRGCCAAAAASRWHTPLQLTQHLSPIESPVAASL